MSTIDSLNWNGSAGAGYDPASAMPVVEWFDLYGQRLGAFDLTSAGLTVGRAAGNSIVLTSEAAARYHLRITGDNQQVFVTYLGTRADGAQLEGASLPAQVLQPWGWEQTLEVGPYRFRLKRQAGAQPERQTAPLGAPLNAPVGAAALHAITLALEPGRDTLDLAPGQPVSFTLTLTNQGHITATPRLIVEGAPAEWVRFQPETVQLVPRVPTPVLVTVTVPSLAASRAGAYPVTIRAVSEMAAGETAARWIVASFSQSSLEVEPKKRIVYGQEQTFYKISVTNTGNATTNYRLRVGYDEPALNYRVGRNAFVVEPGQEVTVEATVDPRAEPSSASHAYTFSVQAIPADGAPLIDTAQLVQEARRYPAWLWPVALVLLLLLLLGSGAFLLQQRESVASASAEATAPAPPTDDAPPGGPSEPPEPTSTNAPTADIAAIVQQTQGVFVQQATAQADRTAQALLAASSVAAQAALAQTVQAGAQAAQAAAVGALQTAQAPGAAQEAAGAAQVAAGAAEAAAAQVIAAVTAQADAAASSVAAQATSTALAETVNERVSQTTVAQIAQTAGAVATQTSVAFATQTAVASAIAATATSGQPAELRIATTLGNVAIGELFRVEVQVIDGTGRLTSSNLPITLAIKGNTNVTLNGQTSVSSVNGVAALNVSIATAGRYVLEARTLVNGVVLTADSQAFNVVATGQPAELRIATNLGNVTVGELFRVEVQVIDATGRLATGSLPITLTIKNNPNVTLNGNTSVSSVNGIAAFNVSIATAGRYVLEAGASANGLTLTTDSQPFNVVVGGQPSELRIATALSTITAGEAFNVEVQVIDGTGRLASVNLPVTLAIKNNPNVTLNGNTSVSSVNGIATFNVSIRTAGSYVLEARASVNGVALTADSQQFTVVAAAATQLAFATSPTNPTKAGVPLNAVVEARDQFGNRNTNFNGTIILSFAPGGNPTGTQLQGALEKSATGGQATFGATGDANILIVGVNYRLRASSGALQPGDSAFFNIDPVEATRLVFTVSPASPTRAGATLSMVVEAQDNAGVRDPNFRGLVSLSFSPDGNPTGAQLQGTLTKAATGGEVTFGIPENVNIQQIGRYRLRATSGTLLPGDSANFNIGADRLVITQSPDIPTRANQPLRIEVRAQDGFGRTDTDFSGTVAIDFAPGGNPTGTTLQGIREKRASGGVVTFGVAGDASIPRIGQNYRLRASTAGLQSGDSATFIIGADRLIITRQPDNPTRSGSPIQLVVEARDDLGNIDPTFNGTVSLTRASGPAATLGGTTARIATNGRVVFGLPGDAAIVRIGTYTLRASSGALNPATSDAFYISADRLVITQSPINPTQANAPLRVVVEAQDADGNIDDTFTGNVTIAFTADGNPTGTSLQGTQIRAATTGRATFGGSGDASIPRVGNGYRLQASAPGFPVSAPSPAFRISADRLVITRQPANPTRAGEPILVTVAAQDGLGNNDALFVDPISLTRTAGPAAPLLGVTTRAAVAGVAEFTATENVRIELVGTGYVLTASTATITPPVATNPFNITNAAASQLVFTLQPVTTTAGAPLLVTVEARDPFNNRASDFTGNVTLTRTAGPVAPLLGVTTRAAVAGVAAFTATENVRIEVAGTGYRLTPGSPGLTATGSNPFNINPAAPARPPTDATGGGAQPINSGFIVTVTVQDQFSNPIPNRNVTFSVIPGPSGASCTITSPASVLTNAAGQASVTCFANPLTGDYAIRVSVDGLATFDVPVNNIN